VTVVTVFVVRARTGRSGHENVPWPQLRTLHNPRRSVEYISTTLKIEHGPLVHVANTWHFFLVPPWRPGPLKKNANGGEPKKDRPITGETSPPHLSEKFIAQLQGAVRAAQRKRIPDPDTATVRSPEKEF
jgi:hypothetical protein